MDSIDNCSKVRYTQIYVPITLPECPPDNPDFRYFMNIVNVGSLSQQNCYIGSQKVEEIQIKRSYTTCGSNAPQWDFTLTVAGYKSEEDVYELLNQLRDTLSLNCALWSRDFQNCGFWGFDYNFMYVRRKYAGEDRKFGEDNLASCGKITAKCEMQLDADYLQLSDKPVKNVLLCDQLSIAFLRALRARDPVSRYILLYYLFEIIYAGENDEKKFHMCAEELGYGNKINKHRAEILLEYMKQTVQMETYRSLGQEHLLTSSILDKIIQARNDLVHRADEGEIRDLMYNHLLPILQEFLNLMRQGK